MIYISRNFINPLLSARVFEDVSNVPFIDTGCSKVVCMSDTLEGATVKDGENSHTVINHTKVSKRLQDKLNADFGKAFNFCVLRSYSVAENHANWRPVSIEGCDKTHSVALLSFGATRELWFEEKMFRAGQVEKTHLKHGAILMFSPSIYDDYSYKIPRKRVLGRHINFCFYRL